MNWFTGIVLYILIWWVTLFAVLPIGTHAVERPDEISGWRGAPERPGIWMKVAVTTIVACVIWLVAFALIESDWISFRHGYFAAPKDYDLTACGGPESYNRLCQARERSSSAWRAVAVSSPNLALVSAKPGRHCVNQMKSICHYGSTVFSSEFGSLFQNSLVHCTIVSCPRFIGHARPVFNPTSGPVLGLISRALILMPRPRTQPSPVSGDVTKRTTPPRVRAMPRTEHIRT